MKFKRSLAVLTTAAILASSYSIVAYAAQEDYAAATTVSFTDDSSAPSKLTGTIYVDAYGTSGDADIKVAYGEATENEFAQKASVGKKVYIKLSGAVDTENYVLAAKAGDNNVTMTACADKIEVATAYEESDYETSNINKTNLYELTVPDGATEISITVTDVEVDPTVTLKTSDADIKLPDPATGLELGETVEVEVKTSALANKDLKAPGCRVNKKADQAGATEDYTIFEITLPSTADADVEITLTLEAKAPVIDDEEVEINEKAPTVWINGKDDKKKGNYYKTATFAVAGAYSGGKWNVAVTTTDYGYFEEDRDEAIAKFISTEIDADKGKQKKNDAAKKLATAKLKDGMVTITAGKELPSTAKGGVGTAYVWVYETKKRAKDATDTTEGSKKTPDDNIWNAGQGKTGVVYGSFDGCDYEVAPICVAVNVLYAYPAPILTTDGTAAGAKIARGKEPGKGETLKLYIIDKKSTTAAYDVANWENWTIESSADGTAHIVTTKVQVKKIGTDGKVVMEDGRPVMEDKEVPAISIEEEGTNKGKAYIEVKIEGAAKAKANITLTSKITGKKAKFAITCGEEKKPEATTTDVKVALASGTAATDVNAKTTIAYTGLNEDKNDKAVAAAKAAAGTLKVKTGSKITLVVEESNTVTVTKDDTNNTEVDIGRGTAGNGITTYEIEVTEALVITVAKVE